MERERRKETRRVEETQSTLSQSNTRIGVCSELCTLYFVLVFRLIL